jgi:hypothetical protein
VSGADAVAATAGAAVGENRTQQVVAPCKVNLTLDVGLARADGYHDWTRSSLAFCPATR